MHRRSRSRVERARGRVDRARRADARGHRRDLARRAAGPQLERSVGDQVTVHRAGPGDTVATRRRGYRCGPEPSTNAQFGGDVIVARADVARVALTEPFRVWRSRSAAGVDADGRPRTAWAPSRGAVARPTRPPGRRQPRAARRAARAPRARCSQCWSWRCCSTSSSRPSRRRRREFDTLRAIGLRPRQTRRTVVVARPRGHSVSGWSIGVPLGIIVGRFAWRVTAARASTWPAA